MADLRGRRNHVVIVKNIIRTAVRHFIPAVGHLVPQPQTHREIGAELHFILEIPGPLSHPVHQHLGIPVQAEWIARNILEKCQQGRVAGASCRKLSGPGAVFVNTLHPNACAVRMLAFGEAQVIGQAVELVYTHKRVDTCGGRGSRWAYGGRATPDGDRTGITSLKKYQVGRDCRPGTVRGIDLACIWTNPPQDRGIDNRRGENMRLRHTQCLAAYRNVLGEKRVGLRRIPLPVANGVVCEKRVFLGDNIVEAGHYEIFMNLLNRAVGVVSSAGGQTVDRVYLHPIGYRPKIVYVRQHALLQIWNLHERSAVRASARRSRKREVARQKTLTRLRIGHNRAVALRQPLLESFVVSEDEHLVLLDRASYRSAELIPFEWALGRFEETLGIQSAVAQILEDIAMPLVRSGRGHNADLPPSPFSILRAIRVLEDVVLPNGLDTEQLGTGPGRRNELVGRVAPDPVHSINQKPVGFLPMTSDRESGIIAASHVRSVIDDADVENQELIEAAPIQRQVFDLLLGN